MTMKNLFTKIILLLGLFSAGVQGVWADRYVYRLIKDNVEYGDLTFDVYNCESVGDGYSFKAPSYYLAVLKSIGGNADEWWFLLPLNTMVKRSEWVPSMVR